MVPIPSDVLCPHDINTMAVPKTCVKSGKHSHEKAFNHRKVNIPGIHTVHRSVFTCRTIPAIFPDFAVLYSSIHHTSCAFGEWRFAVLVDVPIGFVAVFVLSLGTDPLPLRLEPLAIAFCPSSMRLYYRNGYRNFPLDRRLCVYEILSAVIPGLSRRVAIVYEGRCVLFNAVIEDMFPVAQDLQAKRSVIKTLQGFLGE